MRRGLAVALGAAVLAVAACGAPAPTTAADIAPTSSAPSVAAPEASQMPTRVSVPRIGVDTSLVPLGLAGDGSIAVPPVDQPMQAGYVYWSAAQAAQRPTVMLGHVNGRNAAGAPVPGVFARLAELHQGDVVRVEYADGEMRSYTIARTSQQPKSVFPTDAVYGVAHDEIRLITCGGSFNPSAHSYLDNFVAYGVPQA